MLVSSGASEWFCTAVLEAEALRTVPRKVSSYGLVLELSAILLEIPAELVGKKNFFEGQVLGTE